MQLKSLCFMLIISCSAFAEYQAKNYYHLIGMPGFSEKLLTMHFKLYEGYVKNTNALTQKIEALEKARQMDSIEYAGYKHMFGWEFDGMRLHELYFENLGGKRPINQNSSFYKKIVQDFGSYIEWEKAFKATGMIRGIGWAILYYDPRANRLYNVWIQEHNINELVKGEPILVMDVWEHAYITEYGLNRLEYIDAFFKNVNWDIVSNRFDIARR